MLYASKCPSKVPGDIILQHRIKILSLSVFKRKKGGIVPADLGLCYCCKGLGVISIAEPSSSGKCSYRYFSYR